MQLCRYPGFNPYFTGTTASTIYSRIWWLHVEDVSILILQEQPLQQRITAGSRNGLYGVSILILQEQPLQPEDRNEVIPWAKCFNPYFTGTTASTCEGDLKNAIYVCFNPYFTGTTASTVCPLQIEIVERISFNPYFTGTTASTVNINYPSYEDEYVSILILQEQPLQQNSLNFILSDPDWFQSLFYRNNRFNDVHIRRTIQGAIVSILILQEQPLQLNAKQHIVKVAIVFQSLFYRNNRFNRSCKSAICSVIRVSILILQEQPLQQNLSKNLTKR